MEPEGVPLVSLHGGAGLLCFSSIQVNTKVSSVMTSGGPLVKSMYSLYRVPRFDPWSGT